MLGKKTLQVMVAGKVVYHPFWLAKTHASLGWICQGCWSRADQRLTERFTNIWLAGFRLQVFC